MKYGIDLSVWQKSINYDEILKNISFAILRIGYGVQYLPAKQKDKMFEQNYEKLYGKIPVGVYYYQYAKDIEGAKKEAENCLKYLNNKPLDLPIFYDIEDKTVQGLSAEELTNLGVAFCEVIQNAGYKAGIYCSKYWAENKLDMNRFQKIWVASYGINDGHIPDDKYKYQNNHDIWQYTSRAQISGVAGFVDMDVMYEDNIEISEPVENVPMEKEFLGDENIRDIQNWLNSNYTSIYNGRIVEDGFYGKETKKALVRALQTELNNQFNKYLEVDGIFGQATKNACVIVKQGARGNITKTIQAMLYCKGYNTNGVDGIFGAGTTGAVRKFQGNVGILRDGIVGKNTFEKLFK